MTVCLVSAREPILCSVCVCACGPVLHAPRRVHTDWLADGRRLLRYAAFWEAVDEFYAKAEWRSGPGGGPGYRPPARSCGWLGG